MREFRRYLGIHLTDGELKEYSDILVVKLRENELDKNLVDGLPPLFNGGIGVA